MPVAAAVIPAVATLFAAHKAGQATKGAANQATQAQQQALQQQTALAAPYTGLGESVIPKLKDLLGIPGGTGADPTSALRSTPGYNFAKQEGLQGTTNAASAMGMGLSGNTLEALDRFGTGLADQTFQSTIGNLQNVAGLGQAAAAGQAANIGNAAGNIGNIAINRGNTQAGIDVNTIAGLTRIGSNAYDNYTLNKTLAGLNPTSNPVTMDSLGIPQG